MKADLQFQTGHGYRLRVETQPHVVAGNLQQTSLTLHSGGAHAIRYPLTQPERKALAAFLLSIPDDET